MYTPRTEVAPSKTLAGQDPLAIGSVDQLQ